MDLPFVYDVMPTEIILILHTLPPVAHALSVNTYIIKQICKKTCLSYLQVFFIVVRNIIVRQDEFSARTNMRQLP